MSDFRCNFITDEFGKIQSRLANNFYWMLKGHPETEGFLFDRTTQSGWPNAHVGRELKAGHRGQWLRPTSRRHGYFLSIRGLGRPQKKPPTPST